MNTKSNIMVVFIALLILEGTVCILVSPKISVKSTMAVTEKTFTHLPVDDSESAIAKTAVAKTKEAVDPKKVALVRWTQVVSRSGNPASDTVQFLKQAIPLAQEVEAKTGVPAAFLCAQAILESDRGRSYLARHANNYFGVKYQHGTPCWYDGSAYQKFANMKDAFEKQGSLLIDPSHGYTPALKYKDDIKTYAQKVQQLGYCPNKQYDDIIHEIASDFFLTVLTPAR
jgi:flagellum-specific peptidoglycan hydrolase FlgJ